MNYIGQAIILCPIQKDNIKEYRRTIITSVGGFVFLDKKRIYAQSLWYIGAGFNRIALGVTVVFYIG